MMNRAQELAAEIPTRCTVHGLIPCFTPSITTIHPGMSVYRLTKGGKNGRLIYSLKGIYTIWDYMRISRML